MKKEIKLNNTYGSIGGDEVTKLLIKELGESYNSIFLKQYLDDSKRTLIDKGNDLNLIHAELGLITELGELNDIVKKHVFYGKSLDTINMVEELGDIMWYLAIVVRFVQDQYIQIKYVNNPEMFIFSQFFDFELINDKNGRDISFNGRENDYIDLMQVQQFISDEKLNCLLKIYNHFTLNLIYLLNCNEKNLTELLTAVNNLLNVTLFFARCLDTTFENILNININKLKVRFPEKFTNELALNRNLEAERNILEKGKLNNV